jgi:hypothetical protein
MAERHRPPKGQAMTAKQRIAEIRARVEAATPGEWKFRGKDSTIRNPGEPPYEYGSEIIARFSENDDLHAEISDGDLDFILAARSDCEFLLERLERAEALLRRMQPLLGLDDRDLIEDYAAFHAEVDDNNG